METNQRPKSSFATIAKAVVATATFLFTVWVFWYNQQRDEIVTVHGILVDENNHPTSALNIRVKQNLHQSFDNNSTRKDGFFEIPNVHLPDNNKLNFIVLKVDSTYEPLDIDIPNPRNIQNGIMSIGLVPIKTSVPFDNNSSPITLYDDDIPMVQEKGIDTKDLAYINTNSGTLALRDEASLNGVVLKRIPRGDPVKIIEYVGSIKEITGRTGRWCKVQYIDYIGKKYIGFVFGGYLRLASN